MDLISLFRAEWIHFSSKRIIWPFLLLAAFLYMAFDETTFGFSDSRPSYVTEADSILFIIGTGQIVIRIGFAFSLMGFIYQSAGGFILHRARIDGLTQAEWLATINVQAIMAASLYCCICILYFLLGLLFSHTKIEVFLSFKSVGFIAGLFLKTFFSFYILALLGLTLLLFVKGRILTSILIGVLVSEYYLNRVLVIESAFFKNWRHLLVSNYFVYKSTDLLWIYAISSGTMFVLLQTILALKTRSLNRFTTL